MKNDELAGVALPVERILQALASAAVPGMFGEVRVEVRLDAAVIDNVTFLVTRTTHVKAQDGKAQPEVLPARGGSERELLVRQALERFRERIRLRPQILAITGSYQDGRLLGCKVEE